MLKKIIRLVLFVSSWVCFGMLVAVRCNLALAQPGVDFRRDIQPLLASRCYKCHGPNTSEGGLRLHEREAALAPVESGKHAIVPGKPQESALLARVASVDDSLRMPPEGKPLTAAQVELLRRWIASGAEFRNHWAFEPVKRPTEPHVKRSVWVRNPIDAFVLHGLEQAGLQPADPADKVALIRRVSFDLTGLPPTPAEVDAFVADNRADAYEQLVDRLLRSPHYGERWARHWLDLVRYAETNSFERDGVKPHAWRFRDYVIRSLNDDKPYDQFIREQLAGDELPQVTPDSIIATGFYRLGLWDDEPADRELARYDTLDDIVTTVSQVFLGMTANCARCHDHKIDPLPQRDYYRLLSFFQNITLMGNGGDQIERPLFYTPDDEVRFRQATDELKRRRDEVQRQLTAFENDALASFERQQTREPSGESVARYDLDEVEYRFYRDHWEKLPDFDNLKPETVGKLTPPLFTIAPATRETDFGFVFVATLVVPKDGEYSFELDSDDGSRLIVDGRTIIEYDGIHGVGKPRTAKTILKAGRNAIRLDYFQGRFGRGLEVAWSGPELPRRKLSATVALEARGKKKENIKQILQSRAKELLGAENGARYLELVKRQGELNREKVPVDFALCISERGPQAPDTFVLLRGNPRVFGEKVEPGFFSTLDPPQPKLTAPVAAAKTSGRRTALAQWIASADNPLTARVVANRIWQFHFGRGIVRSSSNFGYASTPPTHPELLDWLADELVRQGWKLKPLHRLICTSNSYRMSSRANAEALAKDPGNDHLWRMDMRRLSAEEVRDAILSVTGALNSKMFGPGVYPEISAEVMAGQSQPGSGWGKSILEEQSRRSIYVHVKRSLALPILADFDVCDTDTSCAARFSTTQPTQALGMINGKFAHDQAAAFAHRLMREGGNSPESRIEFSLRLALGRKPTSDDIQRGMRLLALLEKEQKLPPDQALKYYCLMVLNLNEFIYLD